MEYFAGKSKGIELFATFLDYEPVVKQVESRHDLKYVKKGLLETPDLYIANSALELKALGIAKNGDRNFEESYFVIQRAVEISLTDVPQRKGEKRYEVSRLNYPTAISFQPGGMFQDKCIIRGHIDTTSSHPESIALLNLFRREIKKRFVCINGVDWVGPEALKLYEKGIPLKSNDASTLSAQDLRQNKVTVSDSAPI